MKRSELKKIEKSNITNDTEYIDPELLTYGCTINVPEYSNWQCYMYGSKPGSPLNTIYRPIKENLPNIFIRFMMKICLGCTWVKDLS